MSVDVHILASQREYYWICEMIRLGYPLLNKAGVTTSYIPVAPRIQVKRLSKYKNRSIHVVKPALEQPLLSKSLPEDREYLTVDEAANKLGVHPRTIRAFIHSGELTAVQLKREYRIYKEDWEKFLKGRRVQPGQEDDQE